jgi:hypothetical protein
MLLNIPHTTWTYSYNITCIVLYSVLEGNPIIYHCPVFLLTPKPLKQNCTEQNRTILSLKPSHSTTVFVECGRGPLQSSKNTNNSNTKTLHFVIMHTTHRLAFLFFNHGPITHTHGYICLCNVYSVNSSPD